MNLLVTGAWSGAKENMEALKRMGHRVRYLQQEKDALPCPYEWVEGVVANGLFLHHPIEWFVHLRYIQLTSAGFDRVPMEYIKEHGLEVYNARGVYSIPMAEAAVGSVLQLYRQAAFFHDHQAARRWEKRRDLRELFGKTVCILGCGSVGTECAKRFAAFGCRVVGVDLFPGEKDGYQKIIGLEKLDGLLPEADVLVLTLPLTEQTRHLIHEERLLRLKQGAVLVNIARGALVDTEALIRALPRLGGAVLDVFEEEPLPEESPLWEIEHVIITPHNSFVGEGDQRRLDEIIIKHLKTLNK